jgi:hypothetical protein
MNDKLETKNIDLRPLTDNGKVWITIRDYDTPEVVAIHDAFKEFCKIEAGNNYTQGLKILLKYYQDDYKFEFLADKIANIDAELQELKNDLVPKLEPKKDVEEFY